MTTHIKSLEEIMSTTPKAKQQTQRTIMDWNKLSDYLKTRSAEICRDNGCTEDQHKCESYAYITRDGLLDICASDYFQGSNKPHAAIPLPWAGTGDTLEAEVDSQCFDMDSEVENERSEME